MPRSKYSWLDIFNYCLQNNITSPQDFTLTHFNNLAREDAFHPDRGEDTYQKFLPSLRKYWRLLPLTEDDEGGQTWSPLGGSRISLPALDRFSPTKVLAAFREEAAKARQIDELATLRKQATQLELALDEATEENTKLEEQVEAAQAEVSSLKSKSNEANQWKRRCEAAEAKVSTSDAEVERLNERLKHLLRNKYDDKLPVRRQLNTTDASFTRRATSFQNIREVAQNPQLQRLQHDRTIQLQNQLIAAHEKLEEQKLMWQKVMKIVETAVGSKDELVQEYMAERGEATHARKSMAQLRSRKQRKFDSHSSYNVHEDLMSLLTDKQSEKIEHGPGENGNDLTGAQF